MRYAPAAVSLAFIGILAVNRVGATGSATPVADLNIGRGSDTVVLDEVSSADVAAAVADMTGMVVAEQAIARAESLAAQTDLTSATEDSLVKPQIVDTDTKTRADIVKHVVAEGETLDSIANQYNITTNTIKWANNITRDRADVGTELTILPINGVLHTVNNGDTPDSIAQSYRSNAKQIIAFNDAEVNGLVSGQQIIVPDGVKPAPRREVLTSRFTRTRVVFSTNWTYLGRYTQFPNPGGYGRGWCTHWAAYRAGVMGNPIGSAWGNAISWPSSARSDGGYIVDHTPRVGAVAQRSNHVAVVEAVSEDGSMIKYSDMNGVGGWGNAVLYNDWVPASSFAWYIYHK